MLPPRIFFNGFERHGFSTPRTHINPTYLKKGVIAAWHEVAWQLDVVVKAERKKSTACEEFAYPTVFQRQPDILLLQSLHWEDQEEKKKQKNDSYAQKSSTVSNLEMSRRLACHVLLLSFLKNHRDHLLGENGERCFA